MIQKGDRSKLDPEILKQLLKLLPEGCEVSIKCVILTEFSVFHAQFEKLALLNQTDMTRSHNLLSDLQGSAMGSLASPHKG